MGRDPCCEGAGLQLFRKRLEPDVTISAPAAPGCPACRHRLDLRARNCARCGRDITRPASTPVQAEVLAMTLIADWLAYRLFMFSREVLHYGKGWIDLFRFDRFDAYALFGFQVLFFGSFVAVGLLLDRTVAERRNANARYLRIRNALHLAMTLVVSVTTGIVLDLFWRLL